MPGFQDVVAQRIELLRVQGLLRSSIISDEPGATHVLWRGRRLLNLCSNDYLGLASDPEVRRIVARAAETWGGAGASRLISGTFRPHREAEQALARWVGQADALVFSSGYAANVGAISSLLSEDDVVFSDALNHASLIDGCRLSRARIVVYPHRDVETLERLLRAHRSRGEAALIVTDAVFSMDGSLAPLAELRALADHFEAGLLVDEAHALGLFGPRGGGAARAAGVLADVTTGMLGKAFGLAGGFVAASESIVRWLESRARSFVFSTGVYGALAAAIAPVLQIVENAEDRRARVAEHRHVLAAALEATGRLAPGTVESPILPVIVGDNATAVTLAETLLERGLFVRAIRPPTVPPGTARLRVVPTAAHETSSIAEAASILVREIERVCPRPHRGEAAAP